MNILKKNNILIIVYDCLYIINISKVVCSIIGMTEYFIVMNTIICDRPRENQAYCAKNDFGVKSTMAIYDV